MKPIKVMWNGKPLREIYPHATKWQVFKFKCKRFFRKVVIGLGFAVSMIVVFQLGGIFNPQLHYQTVEAIKEVEKTAPVLERIAKCESGGKHYDSNGQVLMRSNTNKSVDVGKYQINTVWFAKATELGLDITKEEDNEKMALWIYKNRGTGDWYASQSCWKK